MTTKVATCFSVLPISQTIKNTQSQVPPQCPIDFVSKCQSEIDNELLQEINQHRINGSPNQDLESSAHSFYSAHHTFIIYGTLAPNRPNHHHISHLRGIYTTDYVHGKFLEQGWGAAMGYPALQLEGFGEKGDRIEVTILESEDLVDTWNFLDEFEGNGYVRVLVKTDGGKVENVYVAK